LKIGGKRDISQQGETRSYQAKGGEGKVTELDTYQYDLRGLSEKNGEEGRGGTSINIEKCSEVKFWGTLQKTGLFRRRDKLSLHNAGRLFKKSIDRTRETLA